MRYKGKYRDLVDSKGGKNIKKKNGKKRLLSQIKCYMSHIFLRQIKLRLKAIPNKERCSGRYVCRHVKNCIQALSSKQ